MARPSRKLTCLPGYFVHKGWRGHNGEDNLETAEEKDRYLQYMNDDLNSKKYQRGATIVALTLMSNHTHEIWRILDQTLFSNHMRRHHARFGRFFNDLRNRSGKVAEDRPHTTLIATFIYQVVATLYVHANPHKANFQDPEHYYYSTHRLYAYGLRCPWMENIAFPEWYLQLGKDWETRQARYRKLFAIYLKLTDGVKLRFLRRFFFGSKEWMQEKEEQLAEWRRARRKAPP
jgi:REP element-mobilizing transposase RayT